MIRKATLNLKLSVWIVCVSLFAAPHLVLAQDYCFEEAGNKYGIAPALLWAISKEESGFNPYAINFNLNGTYDYCHMQINSAWASKIGQRAWASLGNPCQCTKIGAWILSRCIENYGYAWEAVGCYHARDKQKRVKYSWMIYDSWKDSVRRDPRRNGIKEWKQLPGVDGSNDRLMP